MFVRGYVLYVSEYIKEQCGLGSHMSYVLPIPLQPLEDMQSFSTSSQPRINKHTLWSFHFLFFIFFAFERLKLQFPVRGWSGAPGTPPQGIDGRFRMMWEGESVWAPDLQVKTDSSPVRLMLCREAALPARDVGYKYSPQTTFPPFPPKTNTWDATL